MLFWSLTSLRESECSDFGDYVNSETVTGREDVDALWEEIMARMSGILAKQRDAENLATNPANGGDLYVSGEIA